MADKTQQQLDDDAALAREAEAQKAPVEAQVVPKNRLDEIEEGGHYILANGVHVNADGIPLKDVKKGK